MPLARPRLRRKGRVNEESRQSASVSGEPVTAGQARQVPAYAAGQGTVIGVPLHDGAPARTPPPDILQELREEQSTEEAETEGLEEQNVETKIEEEEAAGGPVATQTANVSGVGEELHSTGHSLTLQGRTDAEYPSSFRTERVRITPATGCEGCDAGDCVRVRGTLVSTYTVRTTVTLPSVNDFPNLTRCQRRRVQDAITNVLAPHEREHVRAFRTYNGTTRQPFDLTICRDSLDAEMQSMHNAEQGARQAAAQALSDALDPFSFDVDIDCEEPPPPRDKRSAVDPAASENDEMEV